MKGQKVLLVYSHARVSESLSCFLQQQGLSVLYASNDGDALYQVLHDPPAVVVIEVSLVNTNVPQLCRRIHEFTQTPIILLGSNGDEAEAIGGLMSGADDYLAPPYRYGELLARMESLLRRLRPASSVEQPPASLNDRSVIIDLSGHRVYVEGKPVTLTRIEYNLFICLVRHAGQALTTKQLMHSVWGAEYYSFESVTWHICRLRKKIEPDPDNPRFIVTVPGFGYRYERDAGAVAPKIT
jgi:DNA-binding response OmpR family regulator